MVEITFVSNGQTDEIVTTSGISASDKIKVFKYIQLQIENRHKNSKISVKDKEGKNVLDYENFSYNDILSKSTEFFVHRENVETDFEFNREETKKFCHIIDGFKLVSECRVNGAKSYSAEISLSIMEKLLENSEKVKEKLKIRDLENEEIEKMYGTPAHGRSQLTFNQKNAGQIGNGFDGPLTWEEIAKHNNINDAWTCINGKVYDITQYIPFHPGRQKILLGAGIDGTEQYNKFHPWVNLDFIMSKYYLGNVINNSPKPQTMIKTPQI